MKVIILLQRTSWLLRWCSSDLGIQLIPPQHQLTPFIGQLPGSSQAVSRVEEEVEGVGHNYRVSARKFRIKNKMLEKWPPFQFNLNINQWQIGTTVTETPLSIFWDFKFSWIFWGTPCCNNTLEIDFSYYIYTFVDWQMSTFFSY